MRSQSFTVEPPMEEAQKAPKHSLERPEQLGNQVSRKINMQTTVDRIRNLSRNSKSVQNLRAKDCQTAGPVGVFCHQHEMICT